MKYINFASLNSKSDSNDSIRLGCRLPPSHLSNARTSSALRYAGSVFGREQHKAMKEAQPFFASLDSLPIYNKGGKQAVLKRYQQFLQKYAKQGIHDKESLRAFIREEHRHFTSLQYLPDFADSNITDITRYTEQCCVQILRAADRKELSKRTAYGFRVERYFELRLCALHECRITRNVG